MIRFSKRHFIASDKNKNQLQEIFDSSITTDAVKLIKIDNNKFKGIFKKHHRWGESIYSIIKINEDGIYLKNTSDYIMTIILSVFYLVFWGGALNIFLKSTELDRNFLLILIISPFFASLIHRFSFFSQEKKATKIYKLIIRNDSPLN